MRHGTLLDSQKYRKFISDRDLALEKLHNHAQIYASHVTSELLTQLNKEIAHLLLYATPETAMQTAHLFEHSSQPLFQSFVPKFVEVFQGLRKSCYLLSYLGELEAIGQATQKRRIQTASELQSKTTTALGMPTLNDRTITHAVWASLMKFRSQILSRLRSALIQDLTGKDALEFVQKAYPKMQEYKRPPRKLKPLREADSDPKDKLEYSYDFVDQDDWDYMVDMYKNLSLPEGRFDQSGSTYDPSVGYFRYNWEIEQDLTDDFVQQVRQGQVQAANDLGIQDGVWTAVIDKKTCEVCCLPRDGHTTSEIETMLSNGQLDKDACDATVPPAHNFCRCQWAPVAQVDEVEGPDWKDFNEWLNT